MEADFVVFQNVVRVLALVGGGLSAIFVAWSGIQWMMAAGDPQRMSMARNSLLGVVAGLVIVGAGFILPGIINDLVIKPSGGISLDIEQGVDCDGIFRERLIINRSVSTASRMNYLINQIQGQYDECGGGFWTPVVRDDVTNTGAITSSCYDGLSTISIGGAKVPESLRASNKFRSGRDSHNNIIVYFSTSPSPGVSGHPSNSAICWLYLSYFDLWANGYLR